MPAISEAVKAVFSVRIEIEPEAAPQPVPVSANGNGAAPSFEQLPTGQLIPQAAPHMDPVAAERLLGPAPRGPAENVRTNRDEAPAQAKSAGGPVPDKVGRNDQCPCGSGKKYKRCHGAAA